MRASRHEEALQYFDNEHIRSVAEEYIGLEETDNGVWSFYFNTVLLATLDERDYIIRG